MKIGILIFSEQLEEQPTQADRFIEAAKKLGHEAVKLYESKFRFEKVESVERRDVESVDVTISTSSPKANGSTISTFYDGKPLEHFDVILTRPNFIEEPSLHSHTVDLLEQAGYRVVNGSKAISISKNKIAQHVLFLEKGIDMPKWSIIGSVDEAKAAVESVGLPCIIKVTFGTIGKGVFYADKMETFSPIVDYLLVRDKNPIIIEEFIKEADRKDVRAFVVGDQVVAAMERTAPKGEVRANMGQGGSGKVTTLSDEEEKIISSAVSAAGLEIAGVDLLRSDRGPLLIEVNANPGIKGIEEVSGIDIASEIIKHITQ